MFKTFDIASFKMNFLPQFAVPISAVMIELENLLGLHYFYSSYRFQVSANYLYNCKYIFLVQLYVKLPSLIFCVL